MRNLLPISFVAFVLLGGALPLRAAQPIALSIPPHVYTGRVLDFDAGNLATSRERAEVRARKADGALLARSNVVVADGSICNYSLAIPMSTVPSSSCAVQGERLAFEVDNGEEIFVISNAFPAVGLPGRVTHVDLVAAKDENQNGFADSYEEDLAFYMEAMGIEGPLSRDGDYDGDGVSNYEEYLAGTDPLSDADCLRILAFGQVPDGTNSLSRLSFLPGLNRTYSVQVSTNLSGKAQAPFHSTPCRFTPDSNDPARTYIQTDSTSPEVHALYLLQEEDHAFYRLRLE